VLPERRRSWAFVLPLLAVLLVAYLLVEAYGRRGVAIRVLATDGHGIRAGAPVMHRGIAVGEVRGVRLTGDLTGVELDVVLAHEADALARVGSRFWIARPRVSLEGVEGLDTLIGARYLAVLPGEPGAAPQREFVALDEPSVADDLAPGGVEVVLVASDRRGLSPGAALTYRGVRVGTVLSLALASDATGIEARARVEPPFVELVRRDTRFFHDGGLDLELGLVSGLRIRLDSLQALLVGSVALAVPPDPGPRVESGHRFELHASPEPDWLSWHPPIPVGALAGAAGPRPEPLRAELSWDPGLFGRRRSRAGWVLPVEGGVLGPLDLLAIPADVEDPEATLVLAGRRYPATSPRWSDGTLAWVSLPLDPGAASAPLAPTAFRAADAPEDALLVGDPLAPPVALAAARLSLGEGGWAVDPALPLDADWTGACAVARSDGRVLGLLVVREGRVLLASPRPWLSRD